MDTAFEALPKWAEFHDIAAELRQLDPWAFQLQATILGTMIGSDGLLIGGDPDRFDSSMGAPDLVIYNFISAHRFNLN